MWVALGPPGAGPIENRTRLGEVQDETMWYRLGPVAESNEGRMSEVFNGICPFCGESDFDLDGLKTHFIRGWCEPFEASGQERGRSADMNGPHPQDRRAEA